MPAPTDVAFTPDGRLLVASQGGTLRLYQPPAYASPTVALTFPANALCSNSERGLLGVVLDPGFATNGYVYLFYTAQKPGTTGCPTGNPNVVNRVSRFTFSPPGAIAIDPASERVLIDNIPSPNGNHNAGDLAFGKDRLLYVTTGEGGIASAARDESFLGGKILRIDPAGATPAARVPAGNPYAQDPSAESCAVAGRTTIAGKTRCSETYAWGLRNPFRFAFDPGAVGTRFFLNDVGQGTWEEIDLGQAGADYGWNVREGPCATGSTTNCGPPPAGMTNPLFAYQHGVRVPGTTSPTSCSSITGGAFVPAGSWPVGYDGSYLFADYVCGWIFQRLPGGSVADFATNLGGSSATSLTFGTAGAGATQALYYTTYAGGGQLRRIRYTGSANRAPVASLAADPTAGSPPLTVSFDASGSSDPDGDVSLTYIWSFGDGSPGIETSLATTTHTYGLGSFTASVRVRDSLGAVSDPATIAIDAGNSPPLPEITSPSASLRFRVGQPLTLSGAASDPEDGTLPASALVWTVLLHHNDHTHPFLGPVSGNDIPLTAPAPEDLQATEASYLEVRLAATDSLGATGVTSLDLLPNRVNVTFLTSPAGLRLEVNGTGITAPRTLVSWEGWALDLNAPAQTDAGGNGYAFASWSDGGAQAHTIATPASAASYTAVFAAGPVLLVEAAAVREGQAGTARSVSFPVRLSNPSVGVVSVDYATADGSGVAGTDYQATSGRLTFAGVITQTVSVPVIGNRTLQPNRTFSLHLSNPAGARVAQGSALGTIVDDDSPGVDLNADARADVLWRKQASGELYAWFLDGTVVGGASFLEPRGPAEASWQIRAVVDLDNDAKQDLLWHNVQTGALYVWYLDGTVLKSAAFLAPSGLADTRWQVRAVADVSGDGKPDILWQNQVSGQLYLWFLDGRVVTGGSYLSPSAVADSGWQVRGAADFDADGSVDLLWQHQRAGELFVWLMSGTRAVGGVLLARFADSRWRLAEVADFDGDADPDILWHNQVTGDLFVWLLDGTAVRGGAYLTPPRFADPAWAIVPR